MLIRLSTYTAVNTLAPCAQELNVVLAMELQASRRLWEEWTVQPGTAEQVEPELGIGVPLNLFWGLLSA